MKPEIINDLLLLEKFNSRIQSFNKVLYCDCEGISLGRIRDSLTSIQIYEPNSDIGYYIDIKNLKRTHKKRLLEVLRRLFEDHSYFFVFFDLCYDYKTMKELGITLTKIYCIKTMPKASSSYDSLQSLVQQECSFQPWEIFEWLKEKYLSRLDFAKNDYTRITKRPITKEHASVALNDAYYMYLAHKKINPTLLPQTEWTGQIKSFMNKLANRRTFKLRITPLRVKNDNHNAKKAILGPKKVMPMLQNKKLKWLACGYLYLRINNSKPLTYGNQIKLRAAVNWCSQHNAFDHKTISELQAAADRQLIPHQSKLIETTIK